MNTDWKDKLLERLDKYYILSLSENYPALELLKTKVVADIESLLKKQREICANELDKNWVIGKETKWQKVLDIVLNAPEPRENK